MAFSRHEQFFSNIDLLKALEVTELTEKPFETPAVAEPRRVEFSLLAAWLRIAARDGGLCFISVAGFGRSTASCVNTDALDNEVADDSMEEPPEAVSLQGVLIVLFLEYTVLVVSILSGAQVLTALRASLATATVTIR